MFEIHQEPSDGVFSVHLNSEEGQMVIRQQTFELVEQNIPVYKGLCSIRQGLARR